MARKPAAPKAAASREEGYAAYENASAATLAKQGNGKPRNELNVDPGWATMRQHLEARP